MGTKLIITIISAINDENERNFVEELYIKHSKTMWKYAMYLTKNKDEADELLQTSFEKIIISIDAVKKINCCKIKSYLVYIVRNAYNTMLLKKYKEMESLEYVDIDELSDLDSNDDYESILKENNSSNILSALENLPDKYRSVLKLKYFYEFNDEQIAQSIGIQASSVRMYKTRALRMLSERMKGSEYNEK